MSQNKNSFGIRKEDFLPGRSSKNQQDSEPTNIASQVRFYSRHMSEQWRKCRKIREAMNVKSQKTNI
jgi:hypothetical protein